MSKFSFIKKWQFHQHSRSRAGMQGWRALLLLFSLLAVMSGLGGAQAQSDYPGGYTLMPLAPDKIVLLSMTADVNFHDDGVTTVAEVQINYRLYNRDKGASQTLRVAIPGYPAPKPPPAEITLFLGGKEVPKTPGNQQWWLADITLKPNQRANLVMTYAAPLGDDPIVHFRYPLELTAQMWPGRLESARFTLSFPAPPHPQSWISLTPENYQLTAESVTWSYDVKDPKQPIDFLFIRPSLWDQIQEARRTAVGNASPGAHKTLGAIYAQLATVTQNPDIFERYYPLAVASYAQAQQLAPADPDAYLALAQLYQLRADLSPDEASSYTALAINELVSALDHGIDDPAIRERVIKGFASLIARARARGDFDAANAYLQRLDALAQTYPELINSADIQSERRALAIDWAQHVLDDQGPAPARAVLAQLFGGEIVQPVHAGFARINSLYVVVRTESHLRILDINAAMREGDATLIAQLARAFEQTDAASVQLQEMDPTLLHVEIPFDDAADLLARQTALADAIPPEPEWALLQAILRPQSLKWKKTDERWRTIERYEEQVSLVAVSADAGMQALLLEQSANSMDDADALNRLLADIWRQEAAVWRNLAENSSARYKLTLHPRPGAPLVQTWSLFPGDEITMTGQAVQYHLGTILLLALGGYLLFLLLTWLLFRLFRR
jgi:hypothetical protein